MALDFLKSFTMFPLMRNVNSIAKLQVGAIFLPSKENYFAGIKIDHCMMDSGANSHLLPLNEEIIKYLNEKLVDPWHNWKITFSGGVGIRTPKLEIEDFSKTNFSVELLKGIHPYKMTLEYLRFYISLDDAEILMKSENLVEKDKKLLQNYWIKTKDINTKFPELKLGQRRKHAFRPT